MLPFSPLSSSINVIFSNLINRKSKDFDIQAYKSYSEIEIDIYK